MSETLLNGAMSEIPSPEKIAPVPGRSANFGALIMVTIVRRDSNVEIHLSHASVSGVAKTASCLPGRLQYDIKGRAAPQGNTITAKCL